MGWSGLFQEDVMKNECSFIVMPREEIKKLYGEATREAIAETHALGLPTTHVDENGAYDEYPDGHREYLA
jgi:hypothetical protein